MIIDGCFPANRAIDLSQKRSWNLNELTPTFINTGGKACEVSYDAAAESDDGIIAVKLGLK